MCPAPLNSGLIAWSTVPTAVAKLTSVGGTSRSSKLPDMESLPPMEPTPRSTWAMSAPSSDAAGLPQRSGTSRSEPKYSWNVRYASLREKPAATSLATLSTTARYAPLNWLADDRYGLKPQDMPLVVVVSPRTGSLAIIAMGAVSCRVPPKGMSTVLAPIVESNISTRPLFEATLRSVTTLLMRSAKLSPSQRGA